MSSHDDPHAHDAEKEPLLQHRIHEVQHETGDMKHHSKPIQRHESQTGTTFIEDTEGAGTGRYDITRLTTYRVFGVLTGTVLQDRQLWLETAVTQFAYFLFFVLLYLNRWDNFSDWVGKESSLRAFMSMFSTLIGLLLSFYTSLNMARWWAMRLGVEDVCKGSSTLTIMLSQITSDTHVLNAVQRYARASLFEVFASSQQIRDPPVEVMVQKGMLQEDEAEYLKRVLPSTDFARAQLLWVWLNSIVTEVHKQGLTFGAPHYCQLVNAVDLGRGGLSKIQTYVETPIPLVYVHLLGLMVKLHNFILILLMALLSVKHSGGKEGTNAVALFRLIFRSFFMPFLYNALLTINTIVTDPFNGDVGDFSFKQFSDDIKGDSKTFLDARRHLPDWILSTKFKPYTKPCDDVAIHPAATTV